MATTTFVDGSTLTAAAWFQDLNDFFYTTCTGQSGGGIRKVQFPAAQVASADVNALDDYEEGTFTPTITFGGASVGVTYTTQAADYTKIGNRTTFNLRIVLSNKGTSTGALLINALPFTSKNNIIITASVRLAGALGSIATCQAYINSNATTIVIETLSAGVATQLTDVEVGNTADISISGTYTVA